MMLAEKQIFFFQHCWYRPLRYGLVPLPTVRHAFHCNIYNTHNSKISFKHPSSFNNFMAPPLISGVSMHPINAFPLDHFLHRYKKIDSFPYAPNGSSPSHLKCRHFRLVETFNILVAHTIRLQIRISHREHTDQPLTTLKISSSMIISWQPRACADQEYLNH